MAVDDLLCPFCGKPPIENRSESTNWTWSTGFKTVTIYRYRCPSGHLSGDWSHKPTEAMESYRTILGKVEG